MEPEIPIDVVTVSPPNAKRPHARELKIDNFNFDDYFFFSDVENDYGFDAPNPYHSIGYDLDGFWQDSFTGGESSFNDLLNRKGDNSVSKK